MTESINTPGPWECTTRRGSWDWVVYSAADPNVEVCQTFHDGTDLNEIGEANARLIAAAPEMLEALHQARIYIEADEAAHGRQFGDGNAIRAAIAKAKGRKP